MLFIKKLKNKVMLVWIKKRTVGSGVCFQIELTGCKTCVTPKNSIWPYIQQNKQ